MAYRIDQIEGIGPSFAEKLATADIKTVEGLLETCATKKARGRVAEATGIPEKKILVWTNMADLMRLKGVGGEFAELLKAAGVDSVKELARRKGENLTAKMVEVNAEKKLTRVNPTQKQVDGWIAGAGELDPVITH